MFLTPTQFEFKLLLIYMKILFIGGSLNQTTMMHKIARKLDAHACNFSPYYADGLVKILAQAGLLNNTILGGRHYQTTLQYLRENKLPIDMRGRKFEYDLVVTGSDSIIQKNIRHKTHCPCSGGYD